MVSATRSQSSAGSHSLGVINSHFRAVSSDAFFRTFPQDYEKFHIIATSEVVCSTDKPIVSWEIGDCITVFGIQKNQRGEITGIAGAHIAARTGLEDMEEPLGAFSADGGTTDIFLIGGDENSISEGLVNTIYDGLNKALGKAYKIVEEKLNLPGEEYVSASLEMDGNFTFCRHS